MGLDILLYNGKPEYDKEYNHVPGSGEGVNKPSLVAPDHLCNRGYLRSSYNEGGFNNVVNNLLGKYGFYYIFEPIYKKLDKAYELFPTKEALTKCKERALDIAKELDEAAPLGAFAVETSFIDTVYSAEEAIQVLKNELAKDSLSEGYVNKKGTFSPNDPIPALAFIPGYNAFKGPTVYVVFRRTRENLEWYITAAKIAAEFCDEAMSLEHPVIHWSS